MLVGEKRSVLTRAFETRPRGRCLKSRAQRALSLRHKTYRPAHLGQGTQAKAPHLAVRILRKTLNQGTLWRLAVAIQIGQAHHGFRIAQVQSAIYKLVQPTPLQSAQGLVGVYQRQPQPISDVLLS